MEIQSFGFPEAWLSLYRSAKMDIDDPFPRHVARSGRPSRLSAIISSGPLSRESKDMIERARSHGITDGFIIPTFGIHQHLGIVAVGQVKSLGVLDLVSVYVVQAVAQAIHTQLEHLSNASLGTRVSLSKREVSILHWIAMGKTNGEIATILGIGLPTVLTYIKRTFQKLDVNDRSAAATRAVKLGIIDI